MNLVVLYAYWYSPCITLERLLREYNIKHENVSVDSLEGEGLSIKYNIETIPALLLFDKDNNLIRKLSGAHSITDLIKFIYEQN